MPGDGFGMTMQVCRRHPVSPFELGQPGTELTEPVASTGHPRHLLRWTRIRRARRGRVTRQGRPVRTRRFPSTGLLLVLTGSGRGKFPHAGQPMTGPPRSFWTRMDRAADDCGLASAHSMPGSIAGLVDATSSECAGRIRWCGVFTGPTIFRPVGAAVPAAYG